MKDEIFKKQDEALMNQFKAQREREVPSGVLNDFSASVEHKILETQGQKSFRFGFPAWAPIWVPVFAVLLVLVSTTLTQYPSRLKDQKRPAVGIQPPVEVSIASKSEISEEVILLQELGEWTEEDEAQLN